MNIHPTTPTTKTNKYPLISIPSTTDPPQQTLKREEREFDLQIISRIDAGMELLVRGRREFWFSWTLSSTFHFIYSTEIYSCD